MIGAGRCSHSCAELRAPRQGAECFWHAAPCTSRSERGEPGIPIRVAETGAERRTHCAQYVVVEWGHAAGLGSQQRYPMQRAAARDNANGVRAVVTLLWQCAGVAVRRGFMLPSGVVGHQRSPLVNAATSASDGVTGLCQRPKTNASVVAHASVTRDRHSPGTALELTGQEPHGGFVLVIARLRCSRRPVPMKAVLNESLQHRCRVCLTGNIEAEQQLV